MEITVSILKDKSRINELMELFATGLGETKREHWLWRFFENNDIDESLLFVAQTPEQRIVGMSGVVPAFYGDKEYKFMQLSDWVVHPDFRGRGIIGQLYRFAVENYRVKNYDFIIEYPNDMSYPLFQKYGFEEKKDIFNNYVSKKRLYLPTSKLVSTDYGEFSLSVSDTLPKDIVFHQRSDKIYRTKEFMQWKYDRNPDTAFRWLTVRRNHEICAYFVFTQTHGRINTAVNVYDFDIYSHGEKWIKKALRVLNQYGNYVDFWGCLNEEDEALLLSSGLQKKPSSTRFMVKAISDKNYPENLTITRIDTDY